MGNLLTIGLGGAGMAIAAQLDDCLGGKIFAVNTDMKSLHAANYKHTLFIGPTTCAGEAAHDPERGRLAALESRGALENLLRGVSRIIIVAGLGGGTGTGAAPVIIELAHSLGIKVVMVAVLPFGFERKRREVALTALEGLKSTGATILVHDNESFLQSLNDPQLQWNDLLNFETTRIVAEATQALALH